MPRNSGLTKRDVVNHGQNGKGSKSRITDLTRYRENFAAIKWRSSDSAKSRTLEELRDDYKLMNGLCI